MRAFLARDISLCACPRGYSGTVFFFFYPLRATFCAYIGFVCAAAFYFSRVWRTSANFQLRSWAVAPGGIRGAGVSFQREGARQRRQRSLAGRAAHPGTRAERARCCPVFLCWSFSRAAGLSLQRCRRRFNFRCGSQPERGAQIRIVLRPPPPLSHKRKPWKWLFVVTRLR